MPHLQREDRLCQTEVWNCCHVQIGVSTTDQHKAAHYNRVPKRFPESYDNCWSQLTVWEADPARLQYVQVPTTAQASLLANFPKVARQSSSRSLCIPNSKCLTSFQLCASPPRVPSKKCSL